MAQKHGPNRLLSYLSIHETVMGQFARDGFVESDGIVLEPFGADALKIEGEIRCLGGLIVTVRKILRVLEGGEADANPLVQTLLYSYNLSVQGWNNVFRYDNAHAHGAHADHHHRHAFDWRTGASQGVMGGA